MLLSARAGLLLLSTSRRRSTLVGRAAAMGGALGSHGQASMKVNLPVSHWRPSDTGGSTASASSTRDLGARRRIRGVVFDMASGARANKHRENNAPKWPRAASYRAELSRPGARGMRTGRDADCPMHRLRGHATEAGYTLR